MVDASSGPFGLDPATLAVIAGIGSAIVMRLLESLLPKGYRFKFVDRWLTRNDDDEGDK